MYKNHEEVLLNVYGGMVESREELGRFFDWYNEERPIKPLATKLPMRYMSAVFWDQRGNPAAAGRATVNIFRATATPSRSCQRHNQTGLFSYKREISSLDAGRISPFSSTSMGKTKKANVLLCIIINLTLMQV